MRNPIHRRVIRVIAVTVFVINVVRVRGIFANDYRMQRRSTTIGAFVSTPSRHWPIHGRHVLRATRTQEEMQPKLTLKKEAPPSAKVLSRDPLVYLIQDLLSKEECDLYMNHVQQLKEQNRTMTRSNPPEVSLDVSKLWPLPILSLGAGIPPLVRILENNQEVLDTTQVAAAVLPPIAIALLTSALLAFSIVTLVRRFSDSSSRTSDAMALNLPEDVLFVRDLVERVSEATHHPWHAWEAPVVTRYEPGAVFARHGDASPTRGSEWSELGGQRVVTAICYLNTVAEGGETSFERLGISVPPTQGSALIFFPANSDTLVADDRTTHESLPPMEEKWIVQMFGRVGPRVPPPLGLPGEYAAQEA